MNTLQDRFKPAVYNFCRKSFSVHFCCSFPVYHKFFQQSSSTKYFTFSLVFIKILSSVILTCNSKSKLSWQGRSWQWRWFWLCNCEWKLRTMWTEYKNTKTFRIIMYWLQINGPHSPMLMLFKFLIYVFNLNIIRSVTTTDYYRTILYMCVFFTYGKYTSR